MSCPGKMDCLRVAVPMACSMGNRNKCRTGQVNIGHHPELL